MRIKRLYLSNFSPILSALDKYEIDLKFHNDKMIHILIGKMGTCKTVILGHLQPFASFGTLDIRNQDSFIIKGETGKKIIEYDVDGISYIITHDYIWNKTTHSIKSYILKNGMELNPNGNQSSFKDMIQLEFGIEQSFLRLIRLGANVANVINMKSTERKSFIASLLQDAEIYALLHKKLSEELRTLTAQINLVSNKMLRLEVDKEDKIKSDINELELTLSDLRQDEARLSSIVIQLEVEIKNILNGETVESFQIYTKDLINKRNQIKSSIDELTSTLNSIKIDYSSDEINRMIGKIEEGIETINREEIEASNRYRELVDEKSKLESSLRIAGDEEYLKGLKDELEILSESIRSTRDQIDNFVCPYSSSQLTTYLSDAQQIDEIMRDLLVYDRDSVMRLFKSDNSALSYAKKQIEKLSYQKMNLQKTINNIRYSENYQIVGPLFIPPFCPGKECPFYKTHPFIISSSIGQKSSEIEIESIMNRIAKLDADIDKYQEYTPIYKTIQLLKTLWVKSFSKLRDINAVNSYTLMEAFKSSAYNRWFSYDDVMKAIELCDKRDMFYKDTERIEKLKNEIRLLSVDDASSISDKIKNISETLDGITTHLNTIVESRRDLENQLTKLNQQYLLLSKRELISKDINDLTLQYNSYVEDIKKREIQLSQIGDKVYLIQSERLKLGTLQTRISSMNSELLESRIRLNEIREIKDEYGQLYEQRELIQYIVYAVSSKEGIPLIMIKMFLDNCKNIVNDLISGIFGDSIEILDFVISENEFKIPYSVNGFVIDDIEKASQGQQSVISIALSFALIRQSMFKYNIMLLDEVDGPLHEKDRQTFINILLRQLGAIDAEQVFIITHNTYNLFTTLPIHVIMTSDEPISESSNISISRV